MLKKCEPSGKRSPRHHSTETREAVERSVFGEGMTAVRAAQAHGVAASTVRRWVGVPAATRGPEPEHWPTARRQAAARVYDNPTVALGDWALMLGWPRTAALRLATLCGLADAEAVSPAREEPTRSRPGWEAVELGRRLRRHLARRIATLDAELAAARPGPDTAKVLRDLGGLKRLLDELGEAGGSDERTAQDRPSGEAAPPADLAALRAAIAARIAAFEEGGAA